jgi:hypothetical protein
MSAMRRLLALMLCLPLPLTAADTQWMTILLDGRKIGHALHERVEVEGRIETTQRMQVTLERGGVTLEVASTETSAETPEGRPLGFRGEILLAGSSRRYEGRITEDGMLEVVLSGIGGEDRRQMPWPEGALLAEGQRLALRAAPEDATSLELLTFQPDALRATRLELAFGAVENVVLPETGRQRLRRVSQRIDMGAGELVTEAWMDEERRILRLRMPMFGTFLDLLACSADCALAPVQSADLLARTLVPAPPGLARRVGREALAYRLRATDEAPISLPELAEQRAAPLDGGWRVSIHPGDSLPKADPPDPALLEPSRWIESDAPEIVAMARREAGDAADGLSRMRRLEEATRRHITVKSLRIGYASALETYRAREGDCTEHALLLAALGRALGIPTRIATGLVYAPQFAGQREVFVPHAWTQAWIDDRWVSFDAAQDGFGSGHIQLGAGDGEPWQFYQGVDQLGRLRIEGFEPVR